MKPSTISSRWYFTFLAMLTALLSLCSQTAWADDCTLENKNNYSVQIEGTNQLRFKFPVYSKTRSDCWIVEGSIKIQIEGSGSTENIFVIDAMEHNISNGDYNPYMKCHKEVDGTLTLFRERGYSNVNIGNAKNQYTTVPTKNNDDNDSYVNLLWKIPAKYRGQKVTISWSMHHNGNSGESDKWLSISNTNISISPAPTKQEPILMDPIISYSVGSPNQIMVPYMIAASDIQSMKAYYTEVNGNSTTNRTMDLGKLSSGFINFDASRRVKDLYIEAVYEDSEKEIITAESDKMAIPMLHHAYGLTAMMQPDGKVLLEWMVPHTNWTDIMDNDIWEIQRNTTGNADVDDSGWSNIGQVEFFPKQERYSYLDESLLQSYDQKPVYYRVRRSITSIWGWRTECGYAQTMLPATLALPTVTEFVAQRTRTWQETFHPVTLNFTVGGPEKDEEGRLILRSADDWKAFAKAVNEGQSPLNVIMANDIDLGSEPLAMAGSGSHPYTGIFDGNGHTLNFTPNDTLNEEAAAPFRYVKDATIKNLHTTGRIISNHRLIGGIVGHAISNDKEVVIESCRSSVIIDAGRRNGDSTHGGIVGANSSSKLTMSNCLFDGSFQGEQSSHNGGFIGWLNTEATIENSLFAPAYIGTKFNNCETFARNKAKLTIVNSYYTMEYVQNPSESGYDSQGRFVIGSEKDWNIFADEVKKVEGKKNVNAILIADISISQPVGMDAWPYVGTFDGNGHTLKVSIDWGTDFWAAPFPTVKDATIKNLHVTGTVKGGDHSAGLIGKIDGAPNVNIERVWVSANITTSLNHVGGFVGHTFDANMNVSDCRFDGTLSAPNSSNSFGGAIFGWGYNGSWTMHRVYECGNYPDITHAGFSYWFNESGDKSTHAWGTNSKSTQCDSSHDWDEMGSSPTSGSGGAVNQIAVAYWYNQEENNTWVFENNIAIPVMEHTDMGVMSAENRTPYELYVTLGDKWQLAGNQVVPLMEISANPAHQTMLWDNRAQLILTTEKTAISDEDVFAIKTDDDWKTFARIVKEAKEKEHINATLEADITITETVGASESYIGTFNGNGHTITVNIDENNLHLAPFSQVRGDVAIRNLNVRGTIKGRHHCAGLVSRVAIDDTRLLIENCHVSADITTMQYGAGILGNAGSGTVAIRNCLFDGSVTNTAEYGSSYAGAFVGGGSASQRHLWKVENCLENGTYTNFEHQGANYCNTDTDPYWSGTNNWTYKTSNWSEINYVGDKIPSQLVAALGNQWMVDRKGKVVPIQDNGARYAESRALTADEKNSGTLQIDLNSPCLDHRFYLTIEQGDANIPNLYLDNVYAKKLDQGDLSIYKFENNVKLTSAKADTLQSSVSLSWETNGVDADFYRILRYDKQAPEQVDTLETNYTQLAYVDHAVRPQHTYVYTIQGVTQCEGDHVSEIKQEGCCKPTGMVRGYVRLANGIGMPNITVEATPEKTDEGNTGTCVTDSTGYFEIGDLRYQGYGKYSLIAYGVGDKQSVSFDETTNLVTNVNFYEQTYYNFAGYVLYEGTSIPVSGVSFLRDGIPVIDASGQPVTTDNSGAFLVNIPSGPHTLQVVKDGHIFKNEGYHIDLDKTEGDPRAIEWKKDISEIYLWDQTQVNLTGRVVGGNIEGRKPLGESLSRNNLGDDVTIVMTLEGDNTSWIVRDQKDGTITERHYAVAHGKEDKDTTRVDAYRHRIVVHPDPVTGEYSIPLFPVKYKVTEIYAKGYPTLFQSGMVSETVDLTNCHMGDTAIYSRIFHNSPTLDIWQFTAGDDKYYGIQRYISRDNAGNSDTLTVWRKETGYTMGYPVFMAGSSVPMLLSAREEYYYNNDKLSNLDVVQLEGGRVIADNQLVEADYTDEVDLDSIGQGTYIFTPQNNTFMQDNKMALRTLKFTLEYDSTYYDIQPIKAYIMSAIPKVNGRRIIAGQNTHLVDILRDPPGSKSSAYIEKGSKISYSYTADYNVQLGVRLGMSLGSGADYFLGGWAGPIGGGTTAGSVVSSDNYASISYDLATNYYNDWSYEYEFETKEKISTSDHPKDVGMNADVYIGMTDNVIVEDAVAVRLVSQNTLNRLKPGIGGKTVVNGYEFNVSGTAQVLARGYDAIQKDSVFLVRDEVLAFSSRINSTFAHSQAFLLDELIPMLIRARNALLMDVSMTESYAQTVANNTQKPVYLSTVPTNDEHFAMMDYYKRILPAGAKADEWNDTILALNNQIQTWAGFIAANEKEKLEAMDLVRVYDFDGRTNVDYNESFSTTEGLHRYWKLPTTINLGGDGFGTSTSNGSGSETASNQHGDPIAVDFKAGGVKFGLNITPLFGFDFNYNNGKSEEYSKEAGFTLSCSRQSNLSVAVYRTRDISADSIAKIAKLGGLNMFYKHVEDNLKNIYNGRPGSSNTTSYIDALSSVPRYRNFVYRTLGGATASPWEEARRTIFYNPGTILDQPTTQINRLRIWAENPSVSNVPFGDPARFTIYMVNESDMPERVSHSMTFFLDDASNPKGAKIYVEGVPLNGSAQDVWLEPNEVVTKQVEVYAASEYDYENIGIQIMDEDDIKHVMTASISAHFVPSAGKINISKPGDKWVVNTESAYDKDKNLYYLPVHIDGFNVNFRNFDHIELQYKLSTQGDKDWVNVCSYYPNTEDGRKFMAAASGEKKLMDNDGFIDANFYGEKDPVEQYYDIRAVAFCRNGSGYLTSSSNILTGIKDTRRPQPFGTPQPTNGILGIGDDIKIAFSEQIAANYLSPVNNFEVLGLTNQGSIQLSTVLQMDGKGVASSMSERDLSAKDFTFDLMMKPIRNNRDMYVFWHGLDSLTDLQLGVTADWHLTARVGGQEVKSTDAIDFSDIRHVAYALDAIEDKLETRITFYNDDKPIGEHIIKGIYAGQHIMFLGLEYEGELLEARLWNKYMSSGELKNYANKRLTGYELGLLDYYPMNEGRGDYVYDKAPGSNDLHLIGATWKVPDGISMKLDGTEAIRLNPNCFNREDYEDYTLMFWFRTNDTDATLISNGEAKEEAGAKDHFNIGFEKGSLFFRSGGQQANVSGVYNDGAWHHVAVTVNRTRNVGNMYVDQSLKQTFAVDSLGGIGGNNLYLGATYNSGLSNLLNGNIDELAMYEMSLPSNVLKIISNQTPTGKELGLRVYLPFSQTEKQEDNSQRLMPTGISIKKYKDNHGNIVENHRDTIIAHDIVERYADRNSYAPMANSGKLENIKYSYVADGKDLYISLDVPDYQIEKTNVYVTVKEVSDLQGNLMASPIAMNLYVYRNPLRWSVKRKQVDMKYGEETTVILNIENLSGQTQEYTIEGLPQWITASQTRGKIGALDEEPITLTISQYINIGDFEEIIYIVGENGISEPLPLNIRVRGDAPEWAVDDNLKAGNMTMHIVARVMLSGEIAHDTDDILTAVGEGHRTLGVAHFKNGGSENGLAYLTVYNTANGKPLSFEFYDASTGRIYVVEKQNMEFADICFVPDTIRFYSDSIMGTAADPVVLYAHWTEVQSIKLQKGWNWASTYLIPEEGSVSDMLNSMGTWEVGEGLELMEADGRHYLITYKAVYDNNTYSERYYWDNGEKVIQLNPASMYRIFTKKPKNIYITGDNVSFSGIQLHQGWNRIGYLSTLNLPLSNALSDYTDKASAGDIIKSQSEFAVLNIDAQGNRTWKGTLEFLRVGEGYMLKRQAETECRFYYPYYGAGTKYNTTNQAPFQAPLFNNTTGSSMNVIARVEGFELEEGDQLVAYCGAETRGAAIPDEEGLFFLSVANGDDAVGFAILRGEEIVATTSHQMPYVDNDVQGSLDNPTIISFVSVENFGEGWYDLQGRRINDQRPTINSQLPPGVYIHNGQRVLIK